jgi:hypothetical protein
MSEQTIEIVAINTVLESLCEQIGDHMFDVLRFHLVNEYHLSINENNQLSCSLGELYTALQDSIGKDAASMIIQDVYLKIEELSNMVMKSI